MIYLNENDPGAAAWLRELIKQGHLPDGHVDERSIIDVQASDLKDYSECHFFAGIGGWPLAIYLARRAGARVLDNVWTGSCPCQPFSTAGQQKGLEDERHLWPIWFDLIRQCRPAAVFGEQVASKAADLWLDHVQTDMETVDYAFAACAFPAASVGAPHIRDRTYWVGYANDTGLEGFWVGHQAAVGHRARAVRPAATASEPLRLANSYLDRFPSISERGLRDEEHHVEPCSGDRGMANSKSSRRREERSDSRRQSTRDRAQGVATGLVNGGSDHSRVEHADGVRCNGRAHGSQENGRQLWLNVDGASGEVDRPGPVNGFWATADWLYCRDGKWRPVESGLEPLVDGFSKSLAALRTIESGAIKEVEKYVSVNETNTDEVLRMVRRSVQQEACWQEPAIRMSLELPAPEVLLAFLLCIEPARTTEVGRSIPKALDEIQLGVLRSVRSYDGDDCAPCRWQPSESQRGEPADSVHVLSFVLARYAAAYWPKAEAAHAAASRVTLLKGFGNAIVIPEAVEFILAADEGRRLGVEALV